MVWLGGLIVLLTFAGIVKKYETRMVLIAGGLLMCIVSGKIGAAVTSFTTSMVNPGLVTVICIVYGFSVVMKWTKCDAHMVHLIVKPLKSVKAIMIPGTIVITWLICIALPSAAGCAAAVGSILIPALMSAGVHPAIAAGSVMLGTWGGVLSPGGSHNACMAKMVNTDVMSIIAVHTVPAIIGALVSIVVFTALAIYRKEHMGFHSENEIKDDDGFKVNYLWAIIPILPLILLVLGSKQVGVLPAISVPQAMLLGVIIAMAVTRQNPGEITKQFFGGMGEAFGSIIGIIIAAGVFTAGMKAIGLTDALIVAMKNSQSIAKLAASYGPFIIAILGGSGDAATLAFNGAITPHAKSFGMGVAQMGSLAQLSGALGRTMSPVAGAAIVCAQIAKVNPMEMSKRTALPMIVTVTVIMFLLS